jgi:hypothetical protein
MTNLTELKLSASRRFELRVVGESFYQPALRRLVETGRPMRSDPGNQPGWNDDAYEARVSLQPEPTNAHDPNAIRVADANGETLGYLSRDDAIEYKSCFNLLAEHGRMAVCRARAWAPGPEATVTLTLDVFRPRTVLAGLRKALGTVDAKGARAGAAAAVKKPGCLGVIVAVVFAVAIPIWFVLP